MMLLFACKPFSNREERMKEKKEEKKEVVVIDRGVKPEIIIGPEWICCRGAYIAVRG